MALSVVKGQKTDVTKAHPGLSTLVVGLGWQADASLDLDASAFLLGADGKVSREEDFIFYGNPVGAHGSVQHQSGGTLRDQTQIRIEVGRVPAEIQKIAFTLTIHEAEQRRQHFGHVRGGYLRLFDPSREQELLRYELGQDYQVETAIVVAELYRHNGEWKFNAIGSGFQGGLAALCGNFGVDVADEAPPAARVEAAPTVQQTPPPATPPPAVDTVSLTKIELRKKGEVVNLRKTGSPLGEILVNLNWNRKKSGGGLFSMGKKGVDLDLGCLYELSDGHKGVVQALGRSFGDYEYEPFVSLDGDDRTGSVSTGENLRINGNKVRQIKRLLVFTYIYSGVANWKDADGVITIKQAAGPDVEVRMDEYDNRKIMCAIALIENVNNETFSVKRLIDFFNGHAEMDRAYGWNMNWKPGRKD